MNTALALIRNPILKHLSKAPESKWVFGMQIMRNVSMADYRGMIIEHEAVCK